MRQLLDGWPGWPPPADVSQIVVAVLLGVLFLTLLHFRGPLWWRRGKWDRRTRTYRHVPVLRRRQHQL